MTQTQWIVLLLKIGLVSGGVILVAWVAVYSKLTKGEAWRNPIGLSLIIEALLVAGLFVPQILSLFFNLNRLDSRIAAWADVALIGLVTPVMIWRTVAWLRLDRAARLLGSEPDDSTQHVPLGAKPQNMVLYPLYCSVNGSAPAACPRHRGARPGKRSSMADSTCSVDDCPAKVLARGWCSRHYQSWHHHGDPLATSKPKPVRPETCTIDDCDGIANEPGAARNWCRKHYANWRRHGDPLARASCAGCGAPIANGKDYRFCMRRECRRLARAEERARDPEKARAAARRQRLNADPVKRRVAEKRHKARTDRKCVRPACDERARKGAAYCRLHSRERSARRYARVKLRLPRRLYERQGGLCPAADLGGCGLPLLSVDGHHVDHLIPIARGGPDDDWNLQLMHWECNLNKLDRLVPAAATAAVLHGIALIEPDGTIRRTKPACLLP